MTHAERELNEYLVEQDWNLELVHALARAHRRSGVRARQWARAREHASDAERAHRHELAELDW